MSSVKNEIYFEFDAVSENESLARVVIAAFLARLDPTVEQIEDVKTAVSEAVTNAIIHGYKEKGGRVVMQAAISKDGVFEVHICDTGVGIADIKQAMQPLFTTDADKERSGMGFAFMESFMDKVSVESKLGEGTKVHMWKVFDDCAVETKPILQAALWNSDGRV